MEGGAGVVERRRGEGTGVVERGMGSRGSREG